MIKSEIGIRSAIANYIEEYANASIYNYRDLAVMAGFTSTGIFYQFMKGEVKVPLDRVPALAEALACDPSHLFVLAMEQYFEPKMFEQMRELILPQISANERGWVDIIRQASRGTDPGVTPALAQKLREIFTA